MRRLYLLTTLFGAAGFVSYFVGQGPRPAAAYALGAASSFGNLWVWDWITRMISPGDHPKKSWGAGLFIGRYLVLWGAGYAIVKALNVNALAVVFGLLTSAAAVLASLIFENVQGFVRKQPNP